jgi:hypothetical protein
MPKITTDDAWFGGGGGSVSHPVGPIGHAAVVLNSSSTGGTTNPATRSHLRTLARTLSSHRQRRPVNYRIMW